METNQYIKKLFLGNIIMLLFYLLCPGLFREIGGAGRVVSIAVLLILVLAVGAAGMYFVEPENRTVMGMAQTIIFPFGLYTVLSYYGENTTVILILASILAIMAVLYFAEASPRKSDDEMKSPTEDIPAALGIWTIVNLGLVALMLAFSFDGLYDLLLKLAEKKS